MMSTRSIECSWVTFPPRYPQPSCGNGKTGIKNCRAGAETSFMDSRVPSLPRSALARMSGMATMAATPRVLTAVAAWTAYVLVWFVLYPLAGAPVSILTMVPMIITAWLWGSTVSVVVGVISLPITLLLFRAVDGFDIGEPIMAGVVLGSVALVGVGWLTGQLRVIVGRLAAEAQQRELVLSDLTRAQQRLRTLSDGLPVGLYRTTPEGKLLDGNSRLVEILGFPDRETMLTANVNDLYPDPASRVGFIERLAEEPGYWQEIKLQRFDGGTIWVRDRARTFVDDRGEVLFYDGVLEDITDIRAAEEALGISNERFRVAFQEAPIGMGLARPDGPILQANNALGRLLGRHPDDLIAVQWHQIVHPDDLVLVSEAIQALAAESLTSTQTELRIMGTGPQPIWAILTIAPIRDHLGAISYLIAHLIDISDRKQAEEALESLVKAKDEFVASVSHELRTPLTVVHGLAHELQGSLHEFPVTELEDLIGLIAEQSSEVAGLVEDLLVAARADIGRLTVFPRELQLVAEIDRVLVSLPGDRNAQVTVEVGNLTLMADPVRLRQIVRNLMTNAFRYGGGKVEVAARLVNGSVHLAITDNGEGIPLEHRETIFEPYQSVGPASGQPNSVGLGLTVSRKLARLMGGDLCYRFETGRSTFELSLPAAATSSAGGAVSRADV